MFTRSVQQVKRRRACTNGESKLPNGLLLIEGKVLTVYNSRLVFNLCLSLPNRPCFRAELDGKRSRDSDIALIVARDDRSLYVRTQDDRRRPMLLSLCSLLCKTWISTLLRKPPDFIAMWPDYDTWRRWTSNLERNLRCRGTCIEESSDRIVGHPEEL